MGENKINKHIEKYMRMVETGKIRACEEQKLLVEHIRKCFEAEDIYVDDKQFENYLKLTQFFPYDKIFPWQEFFLGLHLCTYRESDGMPRWPDALALIARGAGKDGTIALESLMVTSPFNGIRAYNVDICANNEEQAMRPYMDLHDDVFEAPDNIKTMQGMYAWNLVGAKCLETKSEIKGRTNSPKGKDGLRSGVVIFNEIHQYENYDNINVFTTGLGKKKHPRRTYYTTNGDVRQGPLDDLIESSERILREGEPDNGLLPFVCKLNNRDEVHDPKNWQMANPSLPYLPSLYEETKKEYYEWKASPQKLPAFMTKRMNLPQSKSEIMVTKWENILATKRELPDMSGWACTVGIDYTKVTDFASVDLHFRNGDERFDINHSWLCLNSLDIKRLKCPWREWADNGLLTVVDDVEIHPDLIADYILQMGRRYSITGIAIDNFRAALLSDSLRRIGFDAKDRKNLTIIRPTDVVKVATVIDSCFANQFFNWGDNPVLRWATNNTKLILASRKTRGMAGDDNGNYTYAKIEGRSRKTDPFMALVAAMTIEAQLGDNSILEAPTFEPWVF